MSDAAERAAEEMVRALEEYGFSTLFFRNQIAPIIRAVYSECDKGVVEGLKRVREQIAGAQGYSQQADKELGQAMADIDVLIEKMKP